MSKVDLTITKVNEVYAKVICERHLLQEMADFFTFMVPGYQFTPSYRNRVWDGKIRLLNIHTQQIYLGLLDYVEEFCETRGYTFSYDVTKANTEDEFSEYTANKFFDSLKLTSAGRPIKVNDHQAKAFIHGMQKRRALLLSPTASGKSLIIYLFIRQLIDYQDLNGLIIVPTTALVEQMYSDFKDYSELNGFDVEGHVHKVYQGKSKTSDKKLIISTWQSVYQLGPEYFNQFDFIIGDEAHLFKSNSLVSILTNCTKTKYRIGLTGTLDGTKTHKLVLEGLFGPVKKVVTTRELMDKKIVTEIEIKCLVLQYSKETLDQLKGADYQTEINFITQSNERNRFIKNLALSLKNNTLILFQKVDKHGKILYDLIRNAKALGDRKVFFIHGEIETEIREQVRIIMETEKDAIVIASYGTFSTGTNIKNLHNVIFGSPSKSRIRNLQSIGRSLRKSDGKEYATLYDIGDDLRIDGWTNHTLKHMVERLKIYSEEKFRFKIYNIGIENGNKSS